MKKISSPFLLLLFFFINLAWLEPNKTIPWRNFHSEIFIFLGFFIIGIYTIKQEKIIISIPHLFIILISTIPLLQKYFGIIIFSGDAIIATLYLLGLFYSVLLGSNAKNNFIFYILIFSIIFSSITSTFIALSQFLEIDWGIGFFNDANDRSFANFGQPNQLATFLCWGIISSTWLFLKQRLTSTSYALTILLLTLGIATTYSRAAHLTILTISLALIYYKNTSKYKFRLPTTIIAIYLFSNTFIYLISEIFNNHARYFSNVHHIGARKIHWLTAIDAIKNAPPFGYGWNQTSVALANTVINHEASHEFIEHSHNLFLDIFIWNGIPLGIIITIYLFSFIKNNIKQTNIDKQIAMIFVISTIPHSMLEFPLEYAYMLLPIGFFAGFSDNGERKIILHKNLFMIFLWIYVILIFYIFIEYKSIEERYQSLRFKSAGIITNTPKEIRISFLDQHEKFLEFASTEAYSGMPAEKISMMNAVSLRFGYPPVLFRHALVSALNGNTQTAEHSLTRICKTASKKICEEAKDNWGIAQRKYKALEEINFPPQNH